MPSESKPILPNGFILQKEGKISVAKRIERFFFTDVYQLSDGSYLFLFLKLRRSDLASGAERRLDVRQIEFGGNEYISVVHSEFDHEILASVFSRLTEEWGLASVAGMTELKMLLMNDVVKPLLQPEKYRKFKIGLPNGILLFGPPGCGKTFIVRKLAEELDYTFVELKPSSVATPYIHGAVSNIARVFEEAREKAPAIVFIDEIEGLIPNRAGLSASADIKREEVNEFLTHLNDAGKNNILVIGATNQPELIDSAVLRAGRMDKKIHVPPPDGSARSQLFQKFLQGRPFSADIDFDKLAKATKNYVTTDIELIVNEAAADAANNDLPEITQELLTKIIKRTKPSVPRSEILRFEKYDAQGRLEENDGKEIGFST